MTTTGGGFIVNVPQNVTQEDVAAELLRCHNFLDDEENPENYKVYRKYGRNPGTLLDHVCKKNDWKRERMEYDVDFKFE